MKFFLPIAKEGGSDRSQAFRLCPVSCQMRAQNFGKSDSQENKHGLGPYLKRILDFS
ncbi:Hypothetical protein Minf_1787 [Methylacidiphilum infernorum V4]|uniref:Uncharacterized protein n=1 Tax=Methylacidiphilum infernorum (isolate V4) TaxID=481448 RepID=B3DXD2_METI4|nr:Hypothetical protein Minf_1787 [Methylacidiphilum infernorum V4]